MNLTLFWKGKNVSAGSDCLVSWDQLCRPIDKGGLGFKNLEIQNSCLLAKKIHRLHVNRNSPWAKWIMKAF